jgi:hypothetical protein
MNMTTKDDGGPAFPAGNGNMDRGGMTLRAWIATHALMRVDASNPNLPGSQAGTHWPGPEELAERRAKWAVLQADALIAELARK